MIDKLTTKVNPKGYRLHHPKAHHSMGYRLTPPKRYKNRNSPSKGIHPRDKS